MRGTVAKRLRKQALAFAELDAFAPLMKMKADWTVPLKFRTRGKPKKPSLWQRIAAFFRKIFRIREKPTLFHFHRRIGAKVIYRDLKRNFKRLPWTVRRYV